MTGFEPDTLIPSRCVFGFRPDIEMSGLQFSGLNSAAFGRNADCLASRIAFLDRLDEFAVFADQREKYADAIRGLGNVAPALDADVFFVHKWCFCWLQVVAAIPAVETWGGSRSMNRTPTLPGGAGFPESGQGGERRHPAPEWRHPPV